jgi:LPS sulfotransferase NodH
MRFSRAQGFVIIFVARSGSTFLQTLLDSHPRIEATGEPFSASGRSDSDSQIAWVRAYWRPAWRAGSRRALGFKTKWVDIADPDRFGKLIRHRNGRVITLYRRNTIKNAVSWSTAQERYSVTGEWNRRFGEPPLSSVYISPAVLEENLRLVELHRQQLEKFFGGVGVPSISIAYEDLLTRREVVLEEVCRFLGVRFRSLSSPLEKNTSDDLRKAIQNFTALRDRYVGTQYEAMFDEVICPYQHSIR